MSSESILHLSIHVALLLLFPPFLLGVVNRTKALFAGRVGPPLLQPYFDLVKLFRKGIVLSRTTTWVFLAGPVVSVATAVFAGMLVPFGNHAPPVSFAGDLIAFAYLFALARFFTVAAALDTGSAFEGMGGAREVTFACLAEPALFFGLLVLARSSGSFSLAGMLAGVTRTWIGGAPALVLVTASLFIVLLAENCRIPVDDPNTHLELTMIHEVMVLDHGGPLLGLILYGAALKLFVMGALLVAIVFPFPFPQAQLAGWAVFLGGAVALAVSIGVVESVMARLRLPQVSNLLIAACVLSAFGVVLAR